MHNRKKNKTIDDLSVAQLLDDFVKVDMTASARPPEKIDDEAYIRMMLKKDVQRELERLRRQDKTQSKPAATAKEDTIDKGIRERFFPDISKESTEEEVSDEESIVTEILDSLVANDMSSLAEKMREAVNFVQDEMGVSESEQRLIETLNRYRKMVESGRVLPQIVDDNVLVIKRCQNCHFCAGERNRNNSHYCLCTNPNRSIEVEINDSWVKSGINLPCWKALRD